MEVAEDEYARGCCSGAVVGGCGTLLLVAVGVCAVGAAVGASCHCAAGAVIGGGAGMYPLLAAVVDVGGGAVGKVLCWCVVGGFAKKSSLCGFGLSMYDGVVGGRFL